ncbi:MAG: hypothetical protein CMJ31_11435 [Phycisphaerae bacterium]|nr:hypothetical protein [Phycisphaerae bacterium]
MGKFKLLAIAGAALCVAPATAQVVINEVWENPPGDGDKFDPFLEYIELYGEPGTDLTGYAVALFKGGSDLNSDDLPETRPEIDEAFELDGVVIGESGIVVLLNDSEGFSDVEFDVPAEATILYFRAQHISPPGVNADVAGKLSNDLSSSYLLVRGRTGHALNASNMSVFDLPDYAWHKDINPDVDFDGKADFGDEGPLARRIEPMQIIDDVAWSHNGGKEYVRDSQQEISDTPGFNPDSISRVAYYGENPMRGLRMNSEGETVPTRMADEEWIYGEQGPPDGTYFYNENIAGPTDPKGDGFEDLDLAGFAMTPGDFNDSAAASVTQFRFVRGDFNFDGVVDETDGDLIAGELNMDLDRETPCLDEEGMPTGFTCWFYEGRSANALLAMMNMDKLDAVGGGNASFVTPADLEAWNDEFGPEGCNAADLAEPFETLDIADVVRFLQLFGAMDSGADIGAPMGVLDIADVVAFLQIFGAGCPS